MHRPVLGAAGRTDLIETFAGGADDVAAGGAGAFDVPAGLLACFECGEFFSEGFELSQLLDPKVA